MVALTEPKITYALQVYPNGLYSTDATDSIQALSTYREFFFFFLKFQTPTFSMLGDMITLFE